MSNEQVTRIARIEKDHHVNIYEQVNGQTRSIYPVPVGGDATQALVQGDEVIVYKKDGGIMVYNFKTKQFRRAM